MKDILQEPVTQWPQRLINDFEAPVCHQYPELQQVNKKLYAAGALYASMTGSGSCFYGIFPKNKVPAIEWPEGYKMFIL